MEVRSQISFRRGRNVLPPCPYGLPHQPCWISFRHYAALCLSSWNSFRGARSAFNAAAIPGRREGPVENDRLVPWRFVLDLLSSLAFQVSLSHAKVFASCSPPSSRIVVLKIISYKLFNAGNSIFVDFFEKFRGTSERGVLLISRSRVESQIFIFLIFWTKIYCH